MLYSDLLFVSVILPLSILAATFDRSTEYKNLILCVVSLLFLCWGKAALSALVFLSVIVDYLLAIAAENSLKRSKASAAVFAAVDLIWNGALFVLLARNNVFSAKSPLHLSDTLIITGAAFYTLKNFSYVYDVFSGRIKAERNIFCLLTYSMAYPFLIAGPAVRYGDIALQIKQREITAEKLDAGAKSFIIGLAKTVLTVPVLSKLSAAGLGVDQDSAAFFTSSWIGIIAFFGCAYFTFMGLSDMGVGIAKMNGFDVNRNYLPLTSKHMLGGLVKSYNTSMVRLFEDIRGGSRFAPLLTVILACAGVMFYADSKKMLVIGLMIGILLAVEYVFGYERIEKITAVIKFPLLFIIAVILFSPFAFDNIGEWEQWLPGLFSPQNIFAVNSKVKYIIINNCWLLLISLISVTPVGRMISGGLDKYGSGSARRYTSAAAIRTLCTALLLAASLIMLAAKA